MCVCVAVLVCVCFYYPSHKLCRMEGPAEREGVQVSGGRIIRTTASILYQWYDFRTTLLRLIIIDTKPYIPLSASYCIAVAGHELLACLAAPSAAARLGIIRCSAFIRILNFVRRRTKLSSDDEAERECHTLTPLLHL